jgi:hypothetical protein
VDAICTEHHDLPLLSTEFTEVGWERPITELMTKGRSSLERLIAGTGNQARFTIDQTERVSRFASRRAGSIDSCLPLPIGQTSWLRWPNN